MRFPMNLTNQKKCPVCKKAGPGTNPPAAPRPEDVTLTFGHMMKVECSADHYLLLGWDAGVGTARRGGTLGAAFFAARKRSGYLEQTELSIHFCSTRCLREFCNAMVDELERRIGVVQPDVDAAKRKSEPRR